ncbi:isochorismatase family protein [Anderseniella sp. Alg231-50]|uniref:isochorismatase family protein n=1 Tax=Anderseniella sp. Alg231-50 TaxID=1922226 RepID=UPI000D55F255
MTHHEISCWHNRTYEFEPASTAFLAIDMQRDFLFDEGGQPNEMARIIPAFSRLTAIMRDLGCMIVHTRESYAEDLSDVTAHKASQGYVGRPGPFGKYLIRGQRGCDFVDELKPHSAEPVIDQPGFGKMHGSGLHEMLQAKKVTHLILAGVTTQCCVHSTLREAVDAGYWCLTVANCCASPRQQWHDAALQLIASESHLFGSICDLQDLVNGRNSGKPDGS